RRSVASKSKSKIGPFQHRAYAPDVPREVAPEQVASRFTVERDIRKACRHSRRTSDRHAQDLVRGARGPVEVGDAAAGAAEWDRGPRGRAARPPDGQAHAMTRITIGPLNASRAISNLASMSRVGGSCARR